MPSEPTVDEVRKLLEELPESWDAHKGYCLSQAAARTVDTLCRHFLASQQPMTAGEFAGLVVEHFEVQEEEFRQKARASKSKNYVDFNLELIDKCTWARRQISSVAREHNITIVEPKK